MNKWIDEDFLYPPAHAGVLILFSQEIITLEMHKDIIFNR